MNIQNSYKIKMQEEKFMKEALKEANSKGTQS